MQLEATVKNLEAELETANGRVVELENDLASSSVDQLQAQISQLERSLSGSQEALTAAK